MVGTIRRSGKASIGFAPLGLSYLLGSSGPGARRVA